MMRRLASAAEVESSWVQADFSPVVFLDTSSNDLATSVNTAAASAASPGSLMSPLMTFMSLAISLQLSLSLISVAVQPESARVAMATTEVSFRFNL